MEQFKENKLYNITGEGFELIFKITEIRRDYVCCGLYLGDDAKVELVDIKTNYVGDMPQGLFIFLKTWFDYGYCNHHAIMKCKDIEAINLHTNQQKFVDPWSLLSCDEVK